MIMSIGLGIMIFFITKIHGVCTTLVLKKIDKKYKSKNKSLL